MIKDKTNPKCKILNVKGIKQLNVNIIGNINQNITIELAPEFWKMTPFTAVLIIGTCICLLTILFYLLWDNGICSEKN